MALIKKKKPLPPVGPTSTKLIKLSNDDLYLLAESQLMFTGQRLDAYRRAAPEDKAAMLAWVQSELETVRIAVEEMASRC